VLSTETELRVCKGETGVGRRRCARRLRHGRLCNAGIYDSNIAITTQHINACVLERFGANGSAFGGARWHADRARQTMAATMLCLCSVRPSAHYILSPSLPPTHIYMYISSLYRLVRDMSKMFCPACGNQTLKRYSLSAQSLRHFY
jgi:hypothetical protein